MNFKIKKLVQIAMVATIYSAATLIFSPLSFGILQFRFSEILTVLAIFSKIPVYGLTIGCFLSNSFGFLQGATMLQDILIGPFATFLAAATSYHVGKNFKKTPILLILGPAPAVVFNAIIIGLELTYFYGGHSIANVISCGIGELTVCYFLGIPFLLMIKKIKLNKLMSNNLNI